MTLLAPDTRTREHTELHEPIPCDSYHCKNEWHLESHIADYRVLFSCGDTMHWCERRYIEYLEQVARAYLIRCMICNEHGVVVSYVERIR